MVLGFGSWCKALCLIPHPKVYSAVQSPAIMSLLVIYMVTTGEFKANVMSMHVKNIQERKLYTGGEKAIGICCTEIKYPKSSELRSLQTVMLCRGPQTTAEMLFASKSHQSTASFMSGLRQCLVENE